MNAAELREALAFEDDCAYDLALFLGPHVATDQAVARLRRVYDAARNIALPILEADPELVERIRQAIGGAMQFVAAAGVPPAIFNATVEDAAVDVLAAISTPTPVEEL